ncbi:hypothetical protein B0H13DRAFT_1854826 [Mycena leptocephala]|nr:hypothetical protein B0H13DRAFT_1854826 [Mycena leptocephala]
MMNGDPPASRFQAYETLPEDTAPGAPVHERAGDSFSFRRAAYANDAMPERRTDGWEKVKERRESGSPWPFNRRAKTAHVKVEMRRMRHAKRKTVSATGRVRPDGGLCGLGRGNTDPAKPGTRFAGGSGGSNLSHNTYPPTNAELFCSDSGRAQSFARAAFRSKLRLLFSPKVALPVLLHILILLLSSRILAAIDHQLGFKRITDLKHQKNDRENRRLGLHWRKTQQFMVCGIVPNTTGKTIGPSKTPKAYGKIIKSKSAFSTGLNAKLAEWGLNGSHNQFNSEIYDPKLLRRYFRPKTQFH